MDEGIFAYSTLLQKSKISWAISVTYMDIHGGDVTVQYVHWIVCTKYVKY